MRFDLRLDRHAPRHACGYYLKEARSTPATSMCGRVQDPYTLRCAPQVLGAARDALTYCERVFSAELGAVTDNPLIFSDDDDVLSGGNFHGEPLALALDFLAIALAQVASFSERRIYNLIGPHDWDNGQQQAGAFPHPTAWAEFRLYDRAVYGGGAGKRDQNTCPSRQHRLDSHVGRYGGFRQHGGNRGHQAADRSSTLPTSSSPLSCSAPRRGWNSADHYAPAKVSPQPTTYPRAGAPLVARIGLRLPISKSMASAASVRVSSRVWSREASRPHPVRLDWVTGTGCYTVPARAISSVG